ncbi:MAG: hypothetical protein QOJ89_4682 [bacterium]
MSRNAAATAAGRARTIRRSPAPPLPRRVSGPAAANRRDAGAAPARAHADPSSRARRALIDPRGLAFADAVVAPHRGMLPAALPRPRTFPAPRPRRLAYGGVAIASRVAGVAVDVSTSRLMDRLVRSRVWIGIIAFGLIGIVAMQVSLLKLNSGIGRAVQTASTLERSNAGLRGDISRLSAGDRIQGLAEAEGLVMPAPADVGYLQAGDPRAAAARAAQRMRAPDPAVAGLAGAIMSPDLDAGVAPAPGGAVNTSAAGATASVPGAAAPSISGSGTAAPGAAAGAPAPPGAAVSPGPAAGTGTAAPAPATGTASPGAAAGAGAAAAAAAPTATAAGTTGAAATRVAPAAATGATTGPAGVRSGGALPGRPTAP